MHLNDIEAWLVGTLEDFKLCHSETLELREMLPKLQPDKTSFIRNKAFSLAREPIETGGATALSTLLWLEKIIKVMDVQRQSNVVSINTAHFSPGEDCRRRLLDLCLSAKTSLDVSVFTISDDRLYDAIVATHKRGVAVRIITDNDKSLDMGSDVELLIKDGIPVRMDKSPYHMHHKFAVVDRQVLVNGSFNWTRSASDKNQENILVTSEPGLVAAYQNEFEQLWVEFA